MKWAAALIFILFGPAGLAEFLSEGPARLSIAVGALLATVGATCFVARHPGGKATNLAEAPRPAPVPQP